MCVCVCVCVCLCACVRACVRVCVMLIIEDLHLNSSSLTKMVSVAASISQEVVETSK